MGTGRNRLQHSTWYFEWPLTALTGQEAKKTQEQEGAELVICNIWF